MEIFEEELLTYNDQYDIPGIGKRDVVKKITKIVPADFICLYLKRFFYDRKKNSTGKLYKIFKFYESLTIPDSDVDEEYISYSLHAIVVHKGDANSGHYILVVKNCYEQCIEFNDSTSRIIENFYISKYWGDENPKSRISSPTAYMLIYIKNDKQIEHVFEFNSEIVNIIILFRLNIIPLN